MSLGLLLIPVVSGYWFLTHLYHTRYSALRDSGYHLFFRSVIAGVILALVAHLMVVVLNPHFPGLSTRWINFIPISYSGTAMLTAMLAFLLPFFGNWVYGEEKAARLAAKESGDLIELLIAESIEDQRLIELSLRNGKSYIGFALESGITGQDEADIALIPMASGYRNKDTHGLQITTNYAPVVQESLDNSSGLVYEDFRIVIPMSEIVSVRIFHPEAYERFKKNSSLSQAVRPVQNDNGNK